MSSLSGHHTITQRAIRELSTAYACHPIAGTIDPKSIPWQVIMRDIRDVVNLGHWSNFGQKHHFMRYKGQAQVEAYNEAVSWIKANATQGAKLLARQLRIHYKHSQPFREISNPLRRPTPLYCDGSERKRRLMESGGDAWAGVAIIHRIGNYKIKRGAVSWHSIGNALHALQDSFSASHVKRSTQSPERPGQILSIEVYDEENKKTHNHHDDGWEGQREDELSLRGRLAVHACKALLAVIINTAIKQRGGNVDTLRGWASFKNTWLALSPQFGTTSSTHSPDHSHSHGHY